MPFPPIQTASREKACRDESIDTKKGLCLSHDGSLCTTISVLACSQASTCITLTISFPPFCFQFNPLFFNTFLIQSPKLIDQIICSGEKKKYIVMHVPLPPKHLENLTCRSYGHPSC